MTPLTYVELFAGAGGLSRGLEMAGWECLAHAEIEPHARAVLRRHWPTTPLFGDVSTLTGQMIAEASGGRPVTMLTGGSPCQDLSIAGKRAGMTDGSGTRSSLFFEQVRLWHELDALQPCPYFLWENVLGAFSSNAGRDFAAVLSALVGTPVTVPEDGWRGGGGVVSGRTGVAAWRVLDCQFFGPPQRRRRVFVLGVRAGGVDPAEVLSLLDRVSGHLEPSAEAGQGIATDAGTGVASGGGVIPIDTRNATRTTDADAQNRQGVGVGEDGDPSPTLTGLFTPAVFDARGNGTGSVVSTLPGDHLNRITDYTPVVMRQREGKAGGGKGPLVSDKSLSLTGHNDQTVFAIRTDQTNANGLGVREGVSHTLDGSNGQAVFAPPTSSNQTLFTKRQYGAYEAAPSVDATLGARDHASQHTDIVMMPTVRPRRLMPIETERLMGWSDRWTERGIDEQGKDYALSDSARYKQCGNGVASPVAAWIGWRLRHTLEGK